MINMHLNKGKNYGKQKSWVVLITNTSDCSVAVFQQKLGAEVLNLPNVIKVAEYLSKRMLNS